MVSTKSAASQSKKPTISTPQTLGMLQQQSSLKQFLIIWISITTLAVFAGGYFIYQLAISNVQKANEIKAQDIFSKLADEKIESLKKAATQLDVLKKPGNDQVSVFSRVTDRVMPATDDIGNILTIFQRIEGDTLVKIDGISKETKLTSVVTTTGSQATSVQPSSVKSFALSFKASGSYEQIQKFLKAIETSQRSFDFTTLKIDGTNDSLTLTMSYKLYYLTKPSIESSSVLLTEYQAKQGSK
ncbi:MAG: hypothetical protein WCI47_02500 [bacterium]